MLLGVAREILVPIDTAWSLVSAFGDLTRWHPGILSCKLDGVGVGAIRTIVYPSGQTIREVLLESDVQKHRIRYRLLNGVQIPVADLVGSVTLTARGQFLTLVDWRYETSHGVRSDLTEFLLSLATRTVHRLKDLEQASGRERAPR